MSRATESEVAYDQSLSKRKRGIIPENEDDKLEIDIALPEPPSKKAKRKEKKLKQKREETETGEDVNGINGASGAASGITVAGSKDPDSAKASKNAETTLSKTPAEHSIWIGNLPFKANKDSIRQFLLNQGGIDGADITRLHMPTAEKGQNKGFAYIDFSTAAVLEIALTLSEKLLLGRKVLIKNAKSFEGRPEKESGKEGNGTTGAKGSTKEPSKRVFVGNLGFDVTREEIAQHFSHAGPVEDVFMATFEDTGKCKGFGWVRFGTIEAATHAVKGFILIEAEPDDDNSDAEQEEDTPEAASDASDDVSPTPHDEPEGGVALPPDTPSHTPSKPAKKKKKPHKWFLNRIHGRTLRCEFAEDAQTRYKKRYGKDKPPRPASELDSATTTPAAERSDSSRQRRTTGLTSDQRRDERRMRFDARKIAPGQALANAPRASGAIVEGKGTKVTFG